MISSTLALCAFTALSSISGMDSNARLATQWMGQYGQTSVFRAAIPMDSNHAGSFLSLGIVVGDQNTRGGSGGVFSGFDLDFILFDYDGVLNGNEFTGALVSTVMTPGSRGTPSPYVPTTLHPGVLFGLDAVGQVQPSVATLGARDAAYSTTNFAVNTSSGWVSLGDGGYMVAGYAGILIPHSSTLYVYVGDAGPRQITGPDCQTYNEDPFLGVETGFGGGETPEPGTLALVILGGLAAVWRRHRAR